VPFLRVIRDKRGYETTYLMHWYREGAKQRSRILYVFRTPGGVRVGREALEPAILREIEREYPDIDFDWRVVLSNQQVVESAPEPRRPRKRKRSEEEGEVPVPAATAPAQNLTLSHDDAGDDASTGEGGGTAAQAPAAQRPPRPSVPSAIEGATPDEQISFLETWYPVIRERIPQRTPDPARQEALLALAERLNPAMWTDADQITAGLQQAGEALERLARVFTKRRRRARRPRKAGEAPSAAEPPASSDQSPPGA
jgi:hypothetical protein